MHINKESCNQALKINTLYLEACSKQINMTINSPSKKSMRKSTSLAIGA